MPNESPTHVLLLCRRAELAERVTRALAPLEVIVWRDAAQLAGCERLDVIVADAKELGTAGELLSTDQVARHAVLVGIGAGEGVDVTLGEAFTEGELHLTVTLGAQIARLRRECDLLAESQAAVLELAETDPLTGLPNRRAWQRGAPAFLERALRTGQPAWLALADLDNFKEINDRQGMAAGDRVLAATGRALATALRRQDLVARIGGDEFGILLVGAGEEQVAEVLSRLRAAVAAPGQVTPSIGYVPAEHADETKLLAAAERAMRAAKAAGGNRVLRGEVH